MKEGAYLLVHESRETDDIKIIGIYSSTEKAEMAIDRLASRPGFREYIEGFSIEWYELDKDNWIEGFVTVYGGDAN